MELSNKELQEILTGVKEKYLTSIRSKGPFVENLESYEKVAKLISKKLPGKKISGSTLYLTYSYRAQEDERKKYKYHINIINALCIYAFNSPFTEYFKKTTSEREVSLNECFTYPVSHYLKIDFNSVLDKSTDAEKDLLLNLSRFKNVFLKNESSPVLPTGFFQDREASDIITNINYLRSSETRGPLILHKNVSTIRQCSLPYSIQTYFNEMNMGALRVLCDEGDIENSEALKKLGCLTFINKTGKPLDSLSKQEILEQTENNDGYYIYDKEVFPDDIFVVKNWLYDELLSLNADGIFVPVKTGEVINGLEERIEQLGDLQEICEARNINIEIAKKTMLFGVKEVFGKGDEDLVFDVDNSKPNRILICTKSQFAESATKIFELIGVPTPGSASINTLSCFIEMALKNKLDPSKKYVILNIGKSNAFGIVNGMGNGELSPSEAESNY